MSVITEKLAPRWATDEEISRAAARRDPAMRAIVTDFLVANNALKAEAVAHITALEAREAELRKALEDAEYIPGDSPVVPVKIAAFMAEARNILTPEKPHA